MGAKVEGLKRLGQGLLNLGGIAAIPIGGSIAINIPNQITKGLAEKGINDEGGLDRGLLSYIPGVYDSALRQAREKRYKGALANNPDFLRVKSVAGGSSGIEPYKKDLDPEVYTAENLYRAIPIIDKRKRKSRILDSDAEYGTLAGRRQRKLEDDAARENSQFIAAKLEAIRQQGIREANEFAIANKRIDLNERRDYDERTDRLSLQNRIAENELKFSMAELGLREQDQANRMTIYNQQLADAKESRNLALIAATLDGLGMTFRGLRA